MDNSEPEDINLMHAQIYDKKLKSALWQAMKVNGGEPENMEKIQNFKGLSEYPKDTILEFIQWSAKTSQEIAENSVTDDNCKKLIELSYFVNGVSPEKQNYELAQVTKVLSESKFPMSYYCDGVNFADLYKFLYSSMCGFPDFIGLDEKAKNILTESYNELVQKVEQDATPENLQKLKSQLFQGKVTPESSFVNLAKAFEDPSVNLFGLPFDKLLQVVNVDAAEAENPL